MKKLNKREFILMIITSCLVILTLTYFYILEPLTKSKFFSSPLTNEYKENLNLLKNEKQIMTESNKIFSQDYWKKTPEAQQLALQIYVQNIISKSNIVNIKSIIPLQISDEEISVQVDLECPLSSLTKLIYSLEKSTIPIKITNLKIQNGENNSVKSQIQVTSLFLKE